MSTLKTNAIRNANASSDGVTLNSDGTIAIPSDKHIVLPSGTTAQRAGSPPSYSLRYNTTLGELEFWDGTNWNTINQTKAWEVDNTATHWWKSEGIASNSSWVAQVGGVNFGTGNTNNLVYSASDSDFNSNKSLSFNVGTVDGYGYLRTPYSDDTYWDPPEAWSVVMVMRKMDHTSNTSFGDSIFVQGYNQTTSGSWAVDIGGDHTWGNGYGEQVGGVQAYTTSGPWPQTGIFCFRCGANGASSNYMWQPSGQSSFTTVATASSLPSSLPGSGFDYLSIGNFDTTSSNHEGIFKVAEIAYYKGSRISDNELSRFSTYAKNKFNI